jgi:predicted transcriptional regulator
MNELTYKRESLIGPNIIAVGQSLKRLFGQLMSEYGMSDVPVMPLSTLLQEGDGIRQHELAARLGVDNTAVVRVLFSLKNKVL